MNPHRARTKTLAATMWPTGSETGFNAMRAVLLALVGSLLVALSAQVQVPMYPVPMTMQPFAVIVIGAAYGARLGFATMLLYIAEGAIGLPVFAGMKGGVAILVGPTGGYIVGFALAAGVVGWLAQRGWDRNVFATAAAMAIGMIVLYAPGVAWLASLIGVQKAIAAGLLPFLVGDAVKIVLGAIVLPGAWWLVGRLRG